MASPHSGSNEILYIQTDKVNITIKGSSSNKKFITFGNQSSSSSLKICCVDKAKLSLLDSPLSYIKNANIVTPPLFFEQQNYEFVIEGNPGDTITFWHENIDLRKSITNSAHRPNILTGIVNFRNYIGFSDLIIKINGNDYIKITIEVYPSKMDYKKDFEAILQDVTSEIYSIAFDFLRKTYLNYKQNNNTFSSPVEFFAIIQNIFNDMLRALDIIIDQPHHKLVTSYEMTEGYKIKRTDNKTLRWIEKHPQYIARNKEHIDIEKALIFKKHVTFDTIENRITKYILLTTIKKLTNFKQNYMSLNRNIDKTVIDRINNMIKQLTTRSNSAVLKDVSSSDSVDINMSLVFTLALGYRDLYKLYLILIRGLSMQGDLFKISFKDTALLYEYWCFIKLNSIMKTKYNLISQDIVKTQSNGLFYSLTQGKRSEVVYRCQSTGEKIVLSYNPKDVDVPTITQKPDNVLTLEKKGSKNKYEYIFDAKYKINPAIKGEAYYNSISQTPGPEIDDINTMHRYRDAIVSSHDEYPYQRNISGAYVLFPYHNEEEYRQHRFYKSIDQVNIGGLPFLPESTKLVEELLDELILESSNSALERNTLPRGIEEKLADTNWQIKDVLVASVQDEFILEKIIKNKTYRINARYIKEEDLPIRIIAINKQKKHFKENSGIDQYGEVIKCYTTKIGDEIYYVFKVKSWNDLNKSIVSKGNMGYAYYTNEFLLFHSTETPELKIKSEEEYRLYSDLNRLTMNAEVNDDGACFKFNDCIAYIHNDNICISRENKVIYECPLKIYFKHKVVSSKAILDLINEKLLSLS